MYAVCLLHRVLVSTVLLILLMSFVCFWFFFFKQKTAYEMRISDWSSDVCSSDLGSAVQVSGCLTAGVARHCRAGGSSANAPRRTPGSGSLAQPDRARRALAWMPPPARFKSKSGTLTINDERRRKKESGLRIRLLP